MTDPHTVAPLDQALEAQLNDPHDGQLRALEDGFRNYSLFEHVSTEAARQQEWFWARFGSFTAIHSGLFAFSSLEHASTLLLWIGLFLGCSWAGIQYLSLGYVERSKRRLHAFERCLGLRPTKTTKDDIPATSTVIGLGVAIACTFAWFLLLVSRHI